MIFGYLSVNHSTGSMIEGIEVRNKDAIMPIR
jgi:hypothetical protein